MELDSKKDSNTVWYERTLLGASFFSGVSQQLGEGVQAENTAPLSPIDSVQYRHSIIWKKDIHFLYWLYITIYPKDQKRFLLAKKQRSHPTSAANWFPSSQKCCQETASQLWLSYYFSREIKAAVAAKRTKQHSKAGKVSHCHSVTRCKI